MTSIIEHKNFLLQVRTALITPVTEMLAEDGTCIATGKKTDRGIVKTGYAIWDAKGNLVAQMRVKLHWFVIHVEVFDKCMRLCGSLKGKAFRLGRPIFHVYDAGGVEFCQIQGSFWGNKRPIVSLDGVEWGMMESVSKYSLKEIFTIESKHSVTFSSLPQESDKRLTLVAVLFIIDRLMKGESL